MTQYTIRLNLGGNLVTQLTQAERILDRIIAKSKGITVPGGGTSGSGGGGGTSGSTVPTTRTRPAIYPSSPYNPRAGLLGVPRTAYPQIDRYYSLSRRLGSNMRREPFNRRFADSFRQINRLQEDFVRNSFSISGWRRNFGNLVGSINAVGKTAGAVVPVLGTLASSLGTGVLGAAIPLLAGAGAVAIGRRVLNSENLTEAISNRAQFNLAEASLGGRYPAAYAQANSLAAQYGFNRAQVVNSINTFSSLGAGDFDDGTAANLSRIAGKISTLSGRPYDVVSLNLQQILSAGTPNSRDIRELLHQAPILGGYASNLMRDQGVSGIDVREFLKDTNNLFAVLRQLDMNYQPSNVARLRGLVDIEKADRWMAIERDMSEYLEISAEAVLEIERSKSRFTESFNETYKPENLRAITSMWTDFWGSILEFAGNAVGTIVNVMGYLNRWDQQIQSNPVLSANLNGGDLIGGLIGRAIGGRGAYTNPSLEAEINRNYAEQRVFDELRFNPRYANVDWDKAGISRDDFVKETAKLIDDPVKSGWIQDNLFTSSDPSRDIPAEWEAWNALSREERSYGPGFGYVAPVFQNFAVEPTTNEEIGAFIRERADQRLGLGWQNGSNAATTAAAEDTRKIEDLTRGSKSLFINFNAPIVDMNNTFNTGSNPQENMDIISRQIEDTVTRSLQIAFANTTRML